MKKTFESLLCAVLYGLLGALVGFFVYELFRGFFDNLWTVEECGSAIVIYSPIAIPAIVGFVGGLLRKLKGLVFKVFLSGFGYLLAWFAFLFVAGFATAGPGGFLAGTLLLGGLCGGAPIYIIIIGE